jgi:hypothetical protein
MLNSKQNFFLAAPNRIFFRNSILSSKPTFKPAKPIIFSSFERWNKFDQKPPEKTKRWSYTDQQTQTLNKFPITSTNSITDQTITPVIPNIVAVPSFALRSTAVCNPPQDDHILSERTQSIHGDISIFKYYLTYNEPKQSVESGFFLNYCIY